MDTHHAFDSNSTTDSGGGDIKSALHDTVRQLDEALAAEPGWGGEIAMTPETDELAQMLRSGAFAKAVRFCAQRAEGGGSGRLAALFLPLVQQLEAAWERDAIEISELAFIFFQIRRLIEISARRAGPPVPQLLSRGTVLLASAPGEGHGFGLQFVADELRLRSWAVTTMPDGAGNAALQDRLEMHAFDALGLSIGHDDSLAGLADLLVELRLTSRNPRLKVLLGGAALVEPAAQYHFLGADHVALDVTDGVRALDRLLASQYAPKGH